MNLDCELMEAFNPGWGMMGPMKIYFGFFFSLHILYILSMRAIHIRTSTSIYTQTFAVNFAIASSEKLLFKLAPINPMNNFCKNKTFHSKCILQRK